MDNATPQYLITASPVTQIPTGEPTKRTRRIELRVSKREHAQIREHAYVLGYDNLAQYLRDIGVQGDTNTSRRQEEDRRKWLQALNRITDQISTLTHYLVCGRQPDDGVLDTLHVLNGMVDEIQRHLSGKQPEEIV